MKVHVPKQTRGSVCMSPKNKNTLGGGLVLKTKHSRISPIGPILVLFYLF